MDTICKFLVRYTNNEKEKKDMNNSIDVLLCDLKKLKNVKYMIVRLGAYLIYATKCQKNKCKMVYIRYFFTKGFYLHSMYIPLSLIKENQHFTLEKVLKSGGYLFFTHSIEYQIYKNYSNAKLITSCN